MKLVCIIFICSSLRTMFSLLTRGNAKLTATINSPVVSIIGLQMFSGPDTLFFI